MRRIALAPVAAGILLAIAGSAQAATKTTSFNVTATVAANCLVSTTDLAFGSFTAVADLTNSSTVKVRCTNGTAYTVKLGSGSGTFATRTMLSGANALAYNLYKDSGYLTVWGDGTGSTQTNGGTGSGLSNAGEATYTVYGKLPVSGNQDAPVGNYADTIQVTVEYN